VVSGRLNGSKMSVLEEINISLACRQSQLGFIWPESEYRREVSDLPTSEG
jgi:hypothetical protein